MIVTGKREEGVKNMKILQMLFKYGPYWKHTLFDTDNQDTDNGEMFSVNAPFLHNEGGRRQ